MRALYLEPLHRLTGLAPLVVRVLVGIIMVAHGLQKLLVEADLGNEVARKLLGDLAYRSQDLEEELAESGITLLSSEPSARRPGVRQQIEICFSSLKRIFGLGETLATTLVGLATRIAAKMTAYTPTPS